MTHQVPENSCVRGEKGPRATQSEHVCLAAALVWKGHTLGVKTSSLMDIALSISGL